MNLQNWRTKSPLFAGMDNRSFALMESLATEVSVSEKEILFKMNTSAERFFLITYGTIAVRVISPSRPAITIQTLGEGSLLGLSWRLPPFTSQWTAQAVVDSTLAAFDAEAVREACENDPVFDARMWRVVAVESFKRLQNARLQLLDLYGME